jgi:hypothetical protein
VLYFRNDLYLTLEKGEFERGGKSTGKNIEVTILVLDSEGKVLEVCIVLVLCVHDSVTTDSGEYHYLIFLQFYWPFESCAQCVIAFSNNVNSYSVMRLNLVVLQPKKGAHYITHKDQCEYMVETYSIENQNGNILLSETS